MGRERKRKTAILTAAIAAAMLVMLLAAGTYLRMQTLDMGPLQAFLSFVRDTFSARR